MFKDNEYCCESLSRSIERGEMLYIPNMASVQFYVNSKPWYGENEIYRKHANYCPYCGTKLHKYLINEYYDALEEALGKESCDIKEEEIPEEFKTDEWWIKRGL